MSSSLFYLHDTACLDWNFGQIMSFTLVIIIDFTDPHWMNENHTVYLIKLMHGYTHIYAVKSGFMIVLGVFCHVCKFQ